MLCEGYIGLLSDKMKQDWHCAVEHPLDIFSAHEEISNASALFDVGEQYFHDKRQVDWGSWVWKAGKTDIEKMTSEEHIQLNTALQLQDGVEYGILIVDSGFSGDDLYGD